MARKNALGRGLGALIEDAGDVNKGKPAASINEIDVTMIEANPWQPRTKFDEERLQELAASIKEIGIVQPLTVRKIGRDRYQLIAGERRFRASKLAGLERVPAYIRTADDDTMLEMALVENIQREDLDPIEVAISYQRLIEECKLTQESMSERVGKKRSTIANYLRLLKLPAEVQLGLVSKEIGMGHARAIISVEDPTAQLMIFDETVKNDLSVRKVEEMVRELNSGKAAKNASKAKPSMSEEYVELKSQLSSFFNTSVQFTRTDNGKGKIVIPFGSDDDLEKIISILDKTKS
ncbi:ParB/RepB/Spo0J family partition protein [Carboxylicivirga sp. N1Y90]|uniref:ParB/RepB/Spo0J family partition protein n=1 Tax=Carboxylicivirga fragile TaxID=3417571 RepID=UPI003D337031|nr:ParB/RepB/Spo0J family partition protein [Marinilabiliaceae bacterium N1Y90]